MMPTSRIALLIAAVALVTASPSASGQQPGGAAIQISTSGSPQDFEVNATTPVLTHDAVSRRVLAVWQLRVRSPSAATLLARVLDEDGTPVGPQFAFMRLGEGFDSVAVAARPRAGGWIVVAAPLFAPNYVPWSQAVAVVVTAGGHVGPRRSLSPIERREDHPSQGMTPPRTSGAILSDTAIALDPRSGRGVVGWYRAAGGATGSGVLVRGIDADGRPVTPVRTIYATPGRSRVTEGALALGYLPEAHGWLAAWRERRLLESSNSGVEDLYARRVRGSGRPRGPVRSLGQSAQLADREPFADTEPTLVTDAVSRGALVLFSRGEALRGPTTHPKPDLQLLRLGADGAPLSRRARSIATTERPLLAANRHVIRDPASGRLVVVYAEDCRPAVKEECPKQRVLAQGFGAAGNRRGRPTVLVPDVADGTVGLVPGRSGPPLLAWPGVVLRGQPIISSEYPPFEPRKSEILVGRPSL